MSTSFDLKPMNFMPYYTRSTDDLAWGLSRDKLPGQLLGSGVSLEMWQATYDALLDVYAQYVDETNGAWNWFVIHYSPMTLVGVPFHIQKKRSVKGGFDERMVELMKSQSKAYEGLGVQVSLVREHLSLGGNPEPVMVGLHFEVVKAPAASQ